MCNSLTISLPCLVLIPVSPLVVSWLEPIWVNMGRPWGFGAGEQEGGRYNPIFLSPGCKPCLADKALAGAMRSRTCLFAAAQVRATGPLGSGPSVCSSDAGCWPSDACASFLHVSPQPLILNAINFTHTYTHNLNRIEIRNLNRYLYTNAHSSIIHYSQ